MSPALFQLRFLGTLVLAMGTLCLGFFLSFQFGAGGVEAQAGLFVLRALTLVAFVIVARAVFEIGRRRGFAVRDAAGRWSLTNLARNLVASGIAFGLMLFIAGPVIASLARAVR